MELILSLIFKVFTIRNTKSDVLNKKNLRQHAGAIEKHFCFFNYEGYNKGSIGTDTALQPCRADEVAVIIALQCLPGQLPAVAAENAASQNHSGCTVQERGVQRSNRLLQYAPRTDPSAYPGQQE